ncbi:MAG: DMT family transporter [Salinarimonadaceae bacterium]|nr:MAG: DMT family transporter [Salinarimonadaceae bacterium]
MQPFVGIAFRIASALAFTMMATSIKYVSVRYPVGQIVFFRSFFALIPLLVWLAWSDHIVNALRTHNLRGHVLRSVINATGMICGFMALAYLPLSDAIAIGYASPLIVVALAAIILKETVRAYRWSAVGVGFAGVILMVTPQFGVVSPELADASRATGAMLAIAAAFFSAIGAIQVRRLTETERTGAIVFYFSMITTLIGLASALLGWNMPDATDFAILVFAGFCGGIGQILLTQSYRYGDASLIAPFEYTSMIWAVAFGWIVFDQLPESAVIGGAAIVISAGVFVIWREHQLGIARRNALEIAAKRSL